MRSARTRMSSRKGRVLRNSERLGEYALPDRRIKGVRLGEIDGNA